MVKLLGSQQKRRERHQRALERQKNGNTVSCLSGTHMVRALSVLLFQKMLTEHINPCKNGELALESGSSKYQFIK